MRRKIAIFLPPLKSVSGGFAVLVQLGNELQAAGQPVCFVGRAQDMPYAVAPYIAAHGHVPMVSMEELRPDGGCVWIVPEGWPQSLLYGLQCGARCIVYIQAWSYALSLLPGGARWDQLPVDFLYVSDPVRLCLQHMTGRDGPILRPAIDGRRFFPPALDALSSPVGGPIRIAWMPRKNKVFTDLVRNAMAQSFARNYPHIKLQWVEIHRLDHAEVAEVLRSCHVFFASGFPEGCPLPPLEAMASGCAVVGFGGFGGFDYMRQADFICAAPLPFLLRPWYGLRHVPFGGNGLYVADGDVMGAVFALEHMCLLMHRGGEELATLRGNMAQTAMAYSSQAQAANVRDILAFLTA